MKIRLIEEIFGDIYPFDDDIDIATNNNSDKMEMDNYIKKYWTKKGYTIKEVNIDDILRDTNNLCDNAMKDRRADKWGKDPYEYTYNQLQGYDVYYPIKLAYENGKYSVIDGNHRIRALANDGYKTIEAIVVERK